MNVTSTNESCSSTVAIYNNVGGIWTKCISDKAEERSELAAATQKKTQENYVKKRNVCFCTRDADKSRGIEGVVVGCESSKLCVGHVDRQVGAGTFHIVPTLFHNPAVLTI